MVSQQAWMIPLKFLGIPNNAISQTQCVLRSESLKWALWTRNLRESSGIPLNQFE